MRKVLVALAVVTVAVLVAAGTARGHHAPGRVTVPGRLSVSVWPGWHVLRGWLSDVRDPAPRLAVASFPVSLSRQSCECGFPNVVNFPRGGAFVFVWEYLRASHRGLARVPRRPPRFNLAADGRVRQTCDGASDTLAFQDAGRVFQVEVYLGPGIRPTLRGRVAAMLDSLHVAPDS